MSALIVVLVFQNVLLKQFLLTQMFLLKKRLGLTAMKPKRLICQSLKAIHQFLLDAKTDPINISCHPTMAAQSPKLVASLSGVI
jgi:hypothetical protein